MDKTLVNFSLTDLSVLKDDCNYGDVRLVGGPNVREGWVEICVNRAWGTVCSEQFSDDDAQIVCSQMNFERNGKGI